MDDRQWAIGEGTDRHPYTYLNPNRFSSTQIHLVRKVYHAHGVVPQRIAFAHLSVLCAFALKKNTQEIYEVEGGSTKTLKNRQKYSKYGQVLHGLMFCTLSDLDNILDEIQHPPRIAVSSAVRFVKDMANLRYFSIH